MININVAGGGSVLTLKGLDVFYKRKGRGGGHYGPRIISARSNGKRLIFSEKYFVKESKRFGHNCLN